MEAFSLLKYWRGGGGGGAAVANIRAHTTGTTTIATSVREKAIETNDDDDDDDGDEGPFFDLEFTVPDDEDGESEGGDEHDSIEDGDSNNGEEEEDDSESAGTDGEQEFNFTVSSGSNGGPTDPNLSLSPSDDLFFKGRLVPLESSSLVFNPSESNSKPQFPVSLLKSATKFRVFMLGFKKAKSTTGEKIETNGATTAASSTETPKPNQQQQQSSKSFTVKFKVEEVPIVSLFTRDSSKSSGNKKQQKPNTDEASSDEKRFSKDVVQKYLKMIKPLYDKASRRYGEKLKFSGQLSSGLGKTAPATISTPISSPTATTTTTTKKEAEAEETEAGAATSNVKISKPANLPAGLRVVCKHLGKSRSASSAVAAVPASTVQAKRKDDSLLQQQDGIQSAILHCKKSFNASRDSDSSLLSRCTSDSTQEKYTKSAINSSEEGKDNSI